MPDGALQKMVLQTTEVTWMRLTKECDLKKVEFSMVHGNNSIKTDPRIKRLKGNI